MSDFPIVLTSAVDGVPGVGTEILAKHLNNLEAKVGIDASTVTTTLDYLLKNAASIEPGHKHIKLYQPDGVAACIEIATGGIPIMVQNLDPAVNYTSLHVTSKVPVSGIGFVGGDLTFSFIDNGGVERLLYGFGFEAYNVEEAGYNRDFFIFDSVANKYMMYISVVGDIGFGDDIDNNPPLFIGHDGQIGVRTSTPTISDGFGIHFFGSKIIRLDTSKTPATAGATGNKGEICWDANYIYVCTGTNAWKRAAIATW